MTTPAPRAAPPEPVPAAGEDMQYRVAHRVRLLRQGSISGEHQDNQITADMLESLAATIARLTAESESMARDAERLTWLDRDDITLDCTTRMDKPIVLIFHARTGQLLGEGLDIRAAIDAALAEERGGK